MPITDWPAGERPREKLLSLGAGALSDAELLAIFLHTGTKNKTAVDIARDLLKSFGDLASVVNAPAKQLCNTHGLGAQKYALLQAALELGKRNLQTSLQKKAAIENSLEMKHFLRAHLKQQQREVFGCVFLDTQHRFLAFEELFHGTINCANVYPREVVKRALHHNAAAVILAHNHPSGNAKPSFADKAMTQELMHALRLIEVRVLDHMIIGESEVTSLAELKWI